MAGAAHVPVLLDRVVELIAPALDAPGAVCVDATLGLGGHSEAILERYPEARLIGVDRDPGAVELATQRLARFSGRFRAVHAVYDELPEVLADLDVPRMQAVLFDLGVSSMQLDERERGFAYAGEAPLDMRMDPTRGRTAAEVVNTYSAEALIAVLRDFGEERFASRIARAIVRARAARPIETSAELVELVREAVPAATRRTGGHPAKRTFQALRIEVNDELGALRRALPAAIELLAVGGRIVVMAYHSLEDRITKQELARRARSTVPPDMPVVPEGHEPELRLLTRGAVKAGEDEVAANPRSASVRVRAAERMREVA
jgi:16S rRNA (cytosine1402-N4)-methyltransferase